MLVLVSQVLAKKMSLVVFLKMAKDSAVQTPIGRSFHQLGTIQEKVRESDLVPLWDGTTRSRLLAERKLLEGAYVCISEFRYIGESESDVTYSRIRALHFTHPSAHTQQ